MDKKYMQLPEENELNAQTVTRGNFQSFELLNLEKLVDRVLSKVTPTWDTRDYVAVNPLFGYRNEEFLQAIKKIQNLRRTLLLPDKTYLKAKYRAGDILDKDLSYALMLYQRQVDGQNRDSIDFSHLIEFLDATDYKSKTNSKINCITDIYDIEFQSNETEKVTNEISKWLSAYFDEGQSKWKLPKNPLGLYASWKNLIRLDAAPSSSYNNLHDLIEDLPNDPHKAIEKLCKIIIQKSPLEEGQLENYLQRLLATVWGWASFVKKFDFEKELLGVKPQHKDPTGLVDLLVIRLSYDVAYFKNSMTLGICHMNHHLMSYSIRSGEELLLATLADDSN
ncbi:MAG: putative inorganic carbon transporter subunit DabA [Bdellovibrionales bacterium]